MTDDAAPAASADAPELLLAPRDGVPPVVVDAEGLRAAAEALAAGTGPIAVDAERASGYRYGQRAYLVQLRREGSGTHLVDPVPLDDLAPLAEVLAGPEWVLHAASQDLPCLREIGLEPAALFDTELAGRLLGFPRVGLAALLEELLDVSLAKEHSAADWSTRPLPEPWLRYAALDVELLVELRDLMEARLREAGKLDWALEEFEAVRTAPPAPPRVDPWRRTSGMHKVRKPRQLAVIRSLWETRDSVARSRDTSPGRILPDSSIVVAASAAVPGTRPDLATLPAFHGRGARRHLTRWQAAVDEALALPDSALPPPTLPADGPPPPRSWADRDPEAAARLTAARTVVSELAEERSLPVENLLTPDLLRRICWTPPEPLDAASLEAALREGGARSWQTGLVLPVLLPALLDPASVPPAEQPPADPAVENTTGSVVR